MNKLTILFLLPLLSCKEKPAVPDYLLGSFSDDYAIEYEITENQFLQKPNIRYHIIEWNIENQFLIAKNDTANTFDGGLYSRIDWMKLPNMEPYTWAFCLSSYNAPTADSAKKVTIANRKNPKKGCNGYPFSRMEPFKQ